MINNLPFLVVLALVLLGLCAFPMIRDLIKGRFDPLDPRNLFLLYYGLQLGIYPLYTVASGRSFSFMDVAFEHDRYWMVMALVMSIAGLIAFLAGDRYARRSKLFTAAPILHGLNTTRVSALLVVCVPIAMYCNYTIYLSGGGLGGYMDSFVETRYAGSGRGYMSFFATSFVCVLAVLVFVTSLRASNPRLWRIASYVLFAISVVSAALSGFRATMVPIILAATMCYHYYVRRFTAVTAALLFGALVVFSALYAVGRGMVEARSAAVDVDQMGRVSFAEGFLVRSPGTEMVANTMASLSEDPNYAYFYPALIESATILVPRSLWINKPKPQSLRYGEQFMSYFLFLRDGSVGNNTGGFSMTVVAYLYWQWGAFAVVGGMLALGFGFGLFYRRFSERMHSQSTAMVYIVFAAGMAKFAEAPQDTMNGLTISTAFVATTLAICRFRIPTRRGPVPAPVPQERIA